MMGEAGKNAESLSLHADSPAPVETGSILLATMAERT